MRGALHCHSRSQQDRAAGVQGGEELDDTLYGFPFLPVLLSVFLGTASQRNDLHWNPFLEVCCWGNLNEVGGII